MYSNSDKFAWPVSNQYVLHIDVVLMKLQLNRQLVKLLSIPEFFVSIPLFAIPAPFSLHNMKAFLTHSCLPVCFSIRHSIRPSIYME
jgi:hypothetical protein